MLPKFITMIRNTKQTSIFIDSESRFYRNCKRQRKRNAKICQDCPIRFLIEELENDNISIIDDKTTQKQRKEFLKDPTKYYVDDYND